MKKTLQECKKMVAKDAGYLNWENAIENFFGTEYFTDLANKMYYEQDQWISVEDALPENANPVIVLYVNKLVRIAWYNDKSAGWQGSYNSVTHWQELPNAPLK